MPSRSPSSARSSRALYAPRLKPLAQAIALLLVEYLQQFYKGFGVFQ
ncbi:hypothetical protein DZ937_031865, partial [Pseudomonas aeruginosa]|nr:hypothetical protein [Pseudomonas aeruginosa]